MPGVTQAFDNDFDMMTNRQEKGQIDADASVGLPSEKENNARENNVAKIKVVVCCSIGYTSSFSTFVYSNCEVDLVENVHATFLTWYLFFSENCSVFIALIFLFLCQQVLSLCCVICLQSVSKV